MKDRIEFNTIRTLKQSGKSDEQIRKHLKLTTSKYTKYREKLGEFERAEVESMILEDVAFEVKSYIDDLHKTISICDSIANSTCTSLERLESEKMRFFCHSELLRIYQSGPQIIASMQVAPALHKAFRDIKKKGEEVVDVEVREVKEEDNAKPRKQKD